METHTEFHLNWIYFFCHAVLLVELGKTKIDDTGCKTQCSCATVDYPVSPYHNTNFTNDSAI